MKFLTFFCFLESGKISTVPLRKSFLHKLHELLPFWIPRNKELSDLVAEPGYCISDKHYWQRNQWKNKVKATTISYCECCHLIADILVHSVKSTHCSCIHQLSLVDQCLHNKIIISCTCGQVLVLPSWHLVHPAADDDCGECLPFQLRLWYNSYLSLLVAVSTMFIQLSQIYYLLTKQGWHSVFY